MRKISLEKFKKINDERLKYIEDFEDNWDGYGARPISSDIINKAYKINKILQYQLIAFPTARNSIQFEMDIDDDYIEFEIMKNKIKCFIIQNNKEYFFDIKYDDFLEINHLTLKFINGEINNE